MRKFVLILVLLAGAVWAEKITLRKIGSLEDSSGRHSLSLSRFNSGEFSLVVEASDSDVESSIILNKQQAKQLAKYIREGWQGRNSRDGTGFGSVHSGNSSASVISTGRTLALCVTEGQLQRFFYLEPGNYNRIASWLSTGGGGGTQKEPGFDEPPSYPTR